MNLVQNRNLEFAAYAMVLARAGGDALQAVELAKTHFRAWSHIEPVLRSAVNSGTTLDPAWAGSLADYRQLDAGFVDSLRSISHLDAALPFSRQLPLHSQLAVASGGIAAAVANEAAVKAVRRLTFSADTLDPEKIAAFIIASDALLRFAHMAGLALLDRELRAAVAEATNVEFLGFLAADSNAMPSSGDILTDLRTVLAFISVVGRGRLLAAISPLGMTQLATLPGAGGEQRFPGVTPQGGVIAGVQFIPTTAVPSDSSGSTLIVYDAEQLALGADPITVAASRAASLKMDDAPAAEASTQVSMFQTSSTAWRVERYCGWQKLFATASAVLTGANYEPAS
ncbi:MAG: hypothetical protein AB7O21_20080 [Gammaproteobacteria bacterium]